MAESTAHGTGSRVVLLARAGKASEQLAEALRQAGANVLTAIDPAQTDEAALRALGPQVVLVALEPSIEAALDKFDALLTDPNLEVIYDEADLAAQRSGWEAARWVRHLAAKLRRDDNVLPPGAENDQDMRPTPGRIAKPAASFTDADFAAFAREAEAHERSVPVDGAPTGSPTPPPIAAAPAAPPPVAPPPAIPAAPTLPPMAVVERQPVEEDISLESLILDELTVDVAPLDAPAPPRAAIDAPSFGELSIEDLQIDEVALESVPAASSNEVAPMRFDDDAFFLEELSANASAGSGQSDVAPFSIDGGFDTDLNFDIEGFDADAPAPARETEKVLSFEELIAANLPREDDAPTRPPAVAPPPIESAAQPRAEPKPTFSFGELSLAPVEDEPVVGGTSQPTAAQDISALEARISRLSLVDIEAEAQASETPAPVAAAVPPPVSGPPPMPAMAPALSAAPVQGGAQGAIVLIEAGLGGPDPTRQLLAAIPAEFAGTVLVRLHLQGGRYDRLVSQMSRAAALPVALAEVGSPASSGAIYFLPEGVGIAAAGGNIATGFGFINDLAPGPGLFAMLPANSAVVFLSGADPQLVAPAMAAAATGTLIVAQSPEDCYDGVACAELRQRGVASGLPNELAARLIARWAS